MGGVSPSAGGLKSENWSRSRNIRGAFHITGNGTQFPSIENIFYIERILCEEFCNQR